MTISQKIKINMNDELKKSLDYQSYLCTKLYNKLLDYCLSIYNPNFAKLSVTQKALYNKTTEIIKENKEFKIVNSSSLYSVSYVLFNAINLFNNGYCKFPIHKSNRLSWFSLFYSMKSNSFNIKKTTAVLKLGMVEKNGKFMYEYVTIPLKQKLIKHKSIINYRIKKEAANYFLIVSLEVDFNNKPKPTNKTIAIDLNHQNFLTAIDSDGTSFIFSEIPMIKYYDEVIDSLKSRRDTKHTSKIVSANGATFTHFSRKYTHYNDVIQKYYVKRKSQIKACLYSTANWLANSYDIIAIGDYTPSTKNTISRHMNRKLINNSECSEFRFILKHVSEKLGKKLIVVDETNTTQKCFYCGKMVAKDPSIRSFVCPVCHKKYNRDVNSAINIGVKAKIFNALKFADKRLNVISNSIQYNVHTGFKIVKNN